MAFWDNRQDPKKLLKAISLKKALLPFGKPVKFFSTRRIQMNVTDYINRTSTCSFLRGIKKSRKLAFRNKS